mmetsp:Transcript_34779/g.48218  ORF Transcript_34779/g.48218 Transcript_34779/m.48218 type:complete len:114 (-) Transcript_34779:1841-2182(-)
MSNLNIGLGSGYLIAGIHGKKTISINFKGNNDFRLSPAGPLHSSNIELSEQVVSICVGALALKDPDVNLRLPVRHCCEFGGLLARDGSVTWDDLGKVLALTLHAQGQRDHVHQ